jgi:hypothetical protein
MGDSYEDKKHRLVAALKTLDAALHVEGLSVGSKVRSRHGAVTNKQLADKVFRPDVEHPPRLRFVATLAWDYMFTTHQKQRLAEVIDSYNTYVSERLHDKVEKGKLTEEQAEEVAAKLPALFDPLLAEHDMVHV